MTIKLLGRGEIKVRVIGADGSPSPFATVTLAGVAFPQDNASGPADANGEILFQNMTEGGYAISAVDGYNIGGRAHGEIPLDGASVTVDVRLAASGTVTGRFRNQTASPVVGGQIKLLNTKGEALAYSYSSVEAASAGVFTFEHVPLGDFVLEGYDSVTDRSGSGGGRITANGGTVNADVIVTPRGIVTGTVLNYAGAAPVDRAKVSISMAALPKKKYETVTAPDGGFTITGIQAGAYTIAVSDPATGLSGGVTGKITCEGEISRVEIRLRASGAVEGMILMPDGVTPALNARICLSGGARTCAFLNVDQLGRYVFENLPTGTTYTLIATEALTHRAGKAVAAINYDGENVATDVTLAGVGRVEGTVYDNDGTTPLSGAAVALRPYQTAVSANYTGYTDVDGRFGFDDVPAGAFTLSVTHPLRMTAASASGSVAGEAAVASLSVTIGPVGTIQGTVFMADGVTPARGGLATFTGCNKTFAAAMDNGGVFILNNIPLCSSFSIKMEDGKGIGKRPAAGGRARCIADNG